MLEYLEVRQRVTERSSLLYSGLIKYFKVSDRSIIMHFIDIYFMFVFIILLSN